MKKNSLPTYPICPEPENPHAGKLLLDEFITPTNIDMLTLSTNCDISINTLIGIVENTCDISKYIDERLCRFFGLTNGFFLRFQQRYYIAKQKGRNMQYIKPL